MLTDHMSAHQGIPEVAGRWP